MKVTNFKDYVKANKNTIIGVTVGLVAIVIAYKRGTYHGAKLIITGLEKVGESGITVTGRCCDGVTRTVNFRAKVID